MEDRTDAKHRDGQDPAVAADVGPAQGRPPAEPERAARQNEAGQDEPGQNEPSEDEAGLSRRGWPGLLRRHPVWFALVAVLVLTAGAGGYWYWLTFLHPYESTDDAFVAARQFAVAPKVSGYIAEVPVTDNQHVEAGAVLLRIDRRDYDRPAAGPDPGVLPRLYRRVLDARPGLGLGRAAGDDPQARPPRGRPAPRGIDANGPGRRRIDLDLGLARDRRGRRHEAGRPAQSLAQMPTMPALSDGHATVSPPSPLR
ncbi:MAG: biotin/lipoyl-binding protein [Methylobacterium sp.]|uniref:biotin/lipoyl-binding protein n=1 Tax=Methylobacterium sp. TaxID=409 RepID=UPI00258DF78E|nr:biotin/lipoyl-binding protein [Methylobacterium sp.]MBY0299354.1 biotin/lipoyl-binding protein [Methylobacterium sp.]